MNHLMNWMQRCLMHSMTTSNKKFTKKLMTNIFAYHLQILLTISQKKKFSAIFILHIYIEIYILWSITSYKEIIEHGVGKQSFHYKSEHSNIADLWNQILRYNAVRKMSFIWVVESFNKKLFILNLSKIYDRLKTF